jgi:hypothetical protein
VNVFSWVAERPYLRNINTAFAFEKFYFMWFIASLCLDSDNVVLYGTQSHFIYHHLLVCVVSWSINLMEKKSYSWTTFNYRDVNPVFSHSVSSCLDQGIKQYSGFSSHPCDFLESSTPEISDNRTMAPSTTLPVAYLTQWGNFWITRSNVFASAAISTTTMRYNCNGTRGVLHSVLFDNSTPKFRLQSDGRRPLASRLPDMVGKFSSNPLECFFVSIVSVQLVRHRWGIM